MTQGAHVSLLGLLESKNWDLAMDVISVIAARRPVSVCAMALRFATVCRMVRLAGCTTEPDSVLVLSQGEEVALLEQASNNWCWVSTARGEQGYLPADCLIDEYVALEDVESGCEYTPDEIERHAEWLGVNPELADHCLHEPLPGGWQPRCRPNGTVYYVDQAGRTCENHPCDECHLSGLELLPLETAHAGHIISAYYMGSGVEPSLCEYYNSRHHSSSALGPQRSSISTAMQPEPELSPSTEEPADESGPCTTAISLVVPPSAEARACALQCRLTALSPNGESALEVAFNQAAPSELMHRLVVVMPWAVWSLSKALRSGQWHIARQLLCEFEACDPSGSDLLSDEVEVTMEGALPRRAKLQETVFNQNFTATESSKTSIEPELESTSQAEHEPEPEPEPEPEVEAEPAVYTKYDTHVVGTRAPATWLKFQVLTRCDDIGSRLSDPALIDEQLLCFQDFSASRSPLYMRRIRRPQLLRQLFSTWRCNVGLRKLRPGENVAAVRGSQAIRAADSLGRTPLHWAAQKGAPQDLVRQLMHAYPEALTLQDSGGSTPEQLCNSTVLRAVLVEEQAAICLQALCRRVLVFYPHCWRSEHASHKLQPGMLSKANDYTKKLVAASQKAEKRSVAFAHATEMMDQDRFQDAEAAFIRARRPKRAIDMYVKEKLWQDAERVAKTHMVSAVADVADARKTCEGQDREDREQRAREDREQKDRDRDRDRGRDRSGCSRSRSRDRLGSSRDSPARRRSRERERREREAKDRLGSSSLSTSRVGESYYDRQRRERREREEAARSSSTSRLRSSLSSDAEKLKEYMKSCGLEAWHAHFVKHTCVVYSTLTLKRTLPSRCQQAKSVRRLRVCTP
jgi:hypothetical protein